MNKTKMILAGTGGAIGLAILVLAFFVWQAFSAKTVALEGDLEAGTDGLESVIAKAESLGRKPIYPCAESVTAIESNRALVAAWTDEAKKLASRGDCVFKPTTPPAFKAFIVADAKRLALLPGDMAGRLIKPDFAFGPFREYIAEGKMPASADLAALQRKWADIATIAEILSASGVAELTDVQVVEKQVVMTAQDKGDRRNRRARQQAKDAEVKGPSSVSYRVACQAKPAAFVKAVNALAVAERFVTVDDFSFSRAEDALAEALGGDEKRAAAKTQALGRRGRRRAGVEADAKAAEPKEPQKGRVVTDPLGEAPMTVVFTLTIHDFRSLEKAADEAKGEGK